MSGDVWQVCGTGHTGQDRHNPLGCVRLVRCPSRPPMSWVGRSRSSLPNQFLAVLSCHRVVGRQFVDEATEGLLLGICRLLGIVFSGDVAAIELGPDVPEIDGTDERPIVADTNVFAGGVHGFGDGLAEGDDRSRLSPRPFGAQDGLSGFAGNDHKRAEWVAIIIDAELVRFERERRYRALQTIPSLCEGKLTA